MADMIQLMNGIRSILEALKAVDRGERALIIANSEPRSAWLGQLFMNVINSMGAEAVLMEVVEKRPLEGTGTSEPLAPVTAAMKKVNAIFHISDKSSIVHTDAREEATAAGARLYDVRPDLADELRAGASPEALRLIQKRTEILAQRLTQASEARMTSPSGTSITMSLAGRDGLALSPMNRVVSSLHYYAEAAISPVEGTAQGTIVTDLAIPGWGYLFREPLRYSVKAGKVVDVSGYSQDVNKVRKMIAEDENASNIAELGIGTSHMIPLPMQGTRRDAARLGTAHIGIGRNHDIGGASKSRIHFDNLMDRASVELDGQYVLKDGALQI